MVNKLFALATVSAVTGLVVLTSASGCTTTEVRYVDTSEGGSGDARPPNYGDNEEPPTTIACEKQVTGAPPAYKSPVVKPGACKPEILTFLEGYLKTAPATATTADIKAAVNTHTAPDTGCADCIFAAPTDKWGPVVVDTAGSFLNTGGCMEIVSGSAACGKGWFDADLCLTAACGDCTADADYKACLAAAAKADCATYVGEANSGCGANLQTYLGECFPQTLTYDVEGPIQAQCIGGLDGGIGDAGPDH